jgi:hypothetical protein
VHCSILALKEQFLGSLMSPSTTSSNASQAATAAAVIIGSFARRDEAGRIAQRRERLPHICGLYVGPPVPECAGDDTVVIFREALRLGKRVPAAMRAPRKIWERAARFPYKALTIVFAAVTTR